MTERTRLGLRGAGCAPELVERFGELEEAGNVQGCVALLRKHRCELVCLLHEAQRPIDVCDWVIRDLEKEI